MKNKHKKILKFTDKNTAQRNEFKRTCGHIKQNTKDEFKTVKMNIHKKNR